MNILCEIGAAKITMMEQSNPDLRWTQVYCEARSLDNRRRLFPVFGLGPLIRQYLSKPITHADIDEAHALYSYSPLFPREMFEHIVDKHNGYFPVKITGKKEGSLARPGEVVYVIESTDPICASLPVLLEQVALRTVWFASTFGVRAYEFWKEIKRFSDITSDWDQTSMKAVICGANSATLDNMMIYGYGHLFFETNPNIYGVKFWNDFYDEDMSTTPSLIQEHNFILTWGGEDAEYYQLESMIKRDDEFCMVMIDTYNSERVLDEYLPKLKPLILKRKVPILISNDITDVRSVMTKTRDKLAKIFGVINNSSGFKRFAAPVKLSQSDDVTLSQLKEIIGILISERWAIDSFQFLIGDQYLQHNFGRQDLGFIQKLCAIETVQDRLVSVNKSPVTDISKTTKKGYQSISSGHIYYENGNCHLESMSVVANRLNIAIRG